MVAMPWFGPPHHQSIYRSHRKHQEKEQPARLCQNFVLAVEADEEGHQKEEHMIRLPQDFLLATKDQEEDISRRENTCFSSTRSPSTQAPRL